MSTPRNQSEDLKLVAGYIINVRRGEKGKTKFIYATLVHHRTGEVLIDGHLDYIRDCIIEARNRLGLK